MLKTGDHGLKHSYVSNSGTRQLNCRIEELDGAWQLAVGACLSAPHKEGFGGWRRLSVSGWGAAGRENKSCYDEREPAHTA